MGDSDTDKIQPQLICSIAFAAFFLAAMFSRLCSRGDFLRINRIADAIDPSGLNEPSLSLDRIELDFTGLWANNLVCWLLCSQKLG
jgi:hypothetical protein